MKRFLWTVCVLAACVVALPPLVSLVVPVDEYRLPDEGRAVRIRTDVDLNVIEAGQGEAVLLIHGLPGSGYDWRATSAAIAAKGMRAIAYDRAGYGKSSVRTSGADTLQDNVADLSDLITALNLDSVWLVGWSYGGVIAMQTVFEGDPRVRGILLVGTGGPDSPDSLPPEAGIGMRIFYSDPVLRWRNWVPSISRGLMSVLSEQAFSGQPQVDWWMPGLIANFSRWETVVTYRNEMFAPIDPAGFIPGEIPGPVRILHGADDRLAPVSIGRYLASVIPDARYVEVEGGSHMLPVTMPERVAAEVMALTGARASGG